MTDLSDTIEDAATNPKRVVGDLGTVEERSIDELIKADRYLAAKTASAAKQGFRIQVIRPPDAVGGAP